jgi:hypothetical protein
MLPPNLMANHHTTLTHLFTEIYAKVLTCKLPDLSAAEMQRLAASAASIAVEQAKAHPYKAGFTVLQLGLAPVLGAGWLTAPLLQAVGFGPLGPIAGTPSISAVLKR